MPNCNKYRYASQDTANSSLYHRKMKKISRKRTMVYYCHICGAWHLGRIGKTSHTVFNYIKLYFKQYGRSPETSEICIGTGIKELWVQKSLYLLRDKYNLLTFNYRTKGKVTQINLQKEG